MKKRRRKVKLNLEPKQDFVDKIGGFTFVTGAEAFRLAVEAWRNGTFGK